MIHSPHTPPPPSSLAAGPDSGLSPPLRSHLHGPPGARHACQCGRVSCTSELQPTQFPWILASSPVHSLLSGFRSHVIREAFPDPELCRELVKPFHLCDLLCGSPAQSGRRSKGTRTRVIYSASLTTGFLICQMRRTVHWIRARSHWK